MSAKKPTLRDIREAAQKHERDLEYWLKTGEQPLPPPRIRHERNARRFIRKGVR